MTLCGDYEIFDPQVNGPLAEVTPAEARAHYALVMDTKEQRVAELKKLARAARIELDDSAEALQRLNARKTHQPSAQTATSYSSTDSPVDS